MKITFFTSVLTFMLSMTSAQTLNYYYGNLHSHTAFSDGCKDSTATGVTDPADAFAYARKSHHFDFLGISEHNHYSSNKNPGFKLPLYQRGMNMADSANKDPNFLTWFGMEWGVTSDYNGHVVIYGFNQLIGWENSIPNVNGNNYDIYNAKTDYDGLFRKIKNNPDAFATLAHPNATDYSTSNNAATALANMPYNSAYDSAIVGTPLRNGYAFSTDTNYSDFPSGDYYSYYKKLLSVGYHVGITYDHDNHYTTFGRNDGGRLVVMAPSLSRASLTSAMKQMHFYASDDWNAKITFNMNGNIMGSIITDSFAPTFNIIHNDGDGEQASSIKIWKGISNSSNSYPSVVYSSSQNNTATYSDSNLAAGVEYFYYAEIIQPDGNWIVTSPIWYKSTVTQGNPVFTSVKENQEGFKFNYFPNPVAQKLSITMADQDDYTISIIDISGRTVLKKEYNQEKEMSIDLSVIDKGLYTLNIKNLRTSVSRQLIVE